MAGPGHPRAARADRAGALRRPVAPRTREGGWYGGVSAPPRPGAGPPRFLRTRPRQAVGPGCWAAPGSRLRLGSRHARDHPGPGRRDRRARPPRPPRRGVRRRRRPGGSRPARAVHPDAQRGPVADVLRVRLGGPAAALPRHGRPRRGAGGRLPLAHRDRGLPVAHRRLATPPSRARTTCWSRPAEPDDRRVPLVPDRRRRGHRGRGRRRRVPCVGATACLAPSVATASSRR